MSASHSSRRPLLGILRTTCPSSVWWVSGNDQPRLVGEYYGLYAVPQAQLLQYVGDVGLDGVLAEEEACGNFGVGQSAGINARTWSSRSVRVCSAAG